MNKQTPTHQEKVQVSKFYGQAARYIFLLFSNGSPVPSKCRFNRICTCGTYCAAKNATHGNLRSCVSINTFCTKTFGWQLCCKGKKRRFNKKRTNQRTYDNCETTPRLLIFRVKGTTFIVRTGTMVGWSHKLFSCFLNLPKQLNLTKLVAPNTTKENSRSLLSLNRFQGKYLCH